MPYKKRYRKKFRKKRVRKKWRQQKVSVGTIAKIAKKVSNMQIRKKQEPKFSNIRLGVQATTLDGRDITCMVFRSGLYQVNQQPSGFLSSFNQLLNQNHPQTYPEQVEAAPSTAVRSGKETRQGDTIELTGLALQGYFLLGGGVNNATIRVSLCSAEQTLSEPVFLLPDVNGMQIRRTIENTEQLNVIRSRYITMNHSAGGVRLPQDPTDPLVNSTRRYNFKMYHRFKRPQRIRYNEGQNSAFPISLASYMDKRYYIIFKSDIPDPSPSGGLPTNIPNSDLLPTLNQGVQFYGRWTAYYRDA